MDNTYISSDSVKTSKAFWKTSPTTYLTLTLNYQQGGDMVRVGGLKFTFEPTGKMDVLGRLGNIEYTDINIPRTSSIPI